ncbi:MAG TPA: DUF11 domain-containing protein [bacterium]|nr:DUF11 domain-containing protein [bacterium]
MHWLKKLKAGFGLTVLLLALNNGVAGATNVAILYDPAFVPTGGASGDEGSNLLASAESFGHTLLQILEITPEAFSAGLAGQQVLLIPDTEVADISAALSDEALQVIADFVEAGGRLVVTNADNSGEDLLWLNAAFGFSMTGASLNNETSEKQAIAAETIFANAPATVLYGDATAGIDPASRPAEAQIIFLEPTLDLATVVLIPVGEGEIIYLGYDWFESDPPNAGEQDGGWQAVLGQSLADADLSVTKAADPIEVEVDDLVTYTITVTNNGPNEAIGVTLTDDVPTGLVVDSISSSQGTCDLASLACDLGNIANGASVTVTVTAFADVEGTVTNTASVTSLTIDGNAGNDSASASVAVSDTGDPVISGGGCSLGAGAQGGAMLPMAGLLVGLAVSWLRGRR